MVFIFGMDVPLIEMFAVLTLLLIITVVMLVISLLKQKKINSKLDDVLKEEREVKEELDLTKLETDKSLMLMKKLVKELGQLHMISKKTKGEMSQLADVSRTAQHIGPSEPLEQSRLIQQMIAHIANIERHVEHENKQLEYVVAVLAALNEEQESEEQNPSVPLQSP